MREYQTSSLGGLRGASGSLCVNKWIDGDESRLVSLTSSIILHQRDTGSVGRPLAPLEHDKIVKIVIKYEYTGRRLFNNQQEAAFVS